MNTEPSSSLADSWGKQPSGIVFSREVITPELAEHILGNLGPERKWSETTVSSYAKAMTAGAWIVNGMPLIFDREGGLIDGLHRVRASVASGSAFTTWVARNVDRETLHTIDQHRRRRYAGALEARGIPHAASLVRVMTRLIRIENGTLGMGPLPISWSRFDAVLAANGILLAEAIQFSERYSGTVIHGSSRATLAFMALTVGKGDKLKAFFNELMDSGVDEEDAGRPLNAANMLYTTLRARQSSLRLDDTDDGRRRAKSYADRDEDPSLALSIMAFNDFCRNTRRREYFWAADRGTRTKVEKGTKGRIQTPLSYDPPHNLGLPLVDEYRGIKGGKFDPARVKDELLNETYVRKLKEGISASSGDDVVVQRLLTPDMARILLDRHNRHNRKIQNTHVEMIKRDILEDRWMVNAQPICFTGDPEAPGADGLKARLLNGQHRLMACVAADRPIEVWMAKNISEAAFPTYDGQAKKAVALDVPGGDIRVLRSAARFQWRVDQGGRPTDIEVPSESEILATVQAHPGMADCISLARTRDFAEVGTAGVMTFFIYHVRSEKPELAEDFLSMMATGTGIPQGNPIAGIRLSLVKDRNDLSRREALKMMMRAWDVHKVFMGKHSDMLAQARIG